ncbi:hypothetical protein FHS40_008135 [Streptomyces spectabilis]|uniref:Uncharacterized protein n=1 Tax=Streptomyces spectabilis TaxID=68270 RepID=A0A7W8B279_STRST|nr:hypothetical protein [Streptomyces spectabilis]
MGVRCTAEAPCARKPRAAPERGQAPTCGPPRQIPPCGQDAAAVPAARERSTSSPCSDPAPGAGEDAAAASAWAGGAAAGAVLRSPGLAVGETERAKKAREHMGPPSRAVGLAGPAASAAASPSPRQTSPPPARRLAAREAPLWIPAVRDLECESPRQRVRTLTGPHNRPPGATSPPCRKHVGATASWAQVV